MNALILIKKEESPKMLLKKAMLRRVFQKAWFFKFTKGYSFSKALKKAWEFEKTKNVKHKEQFLLF